MLTTAPKDADGCILLGAVAKMEILAKFTASLFFANPHGGDHRVRGPARGQLYLDDDKPKNFWSRLAGNGTFLVKERSCLPDSARTSVGSA